MKETSKETSFLTFFPLPQFVAMPAVGVDVSDRSVKVLELRKTKHDFVLGTFVTKPLPKGVIENGKVVERGKLVAVLRSLRQEFGLRFVRVSLPEEHGYLFTTEVPSVAPKEINSLLEFKLEDNVPIAPSEAVFDYDVVQGNTHNTRGTLQVVVSVFPKTLAESYMQLFHEAELVPLSFEIEAQAIARAVIRKGDLDTYMVVDFGKTRSGISIVSGGVVHFTTTVEIGGDSLTDAVLEHFPNASPAEIDRIKNEEGCVRTKDNSKLCTSMMNTVSVLRDEMGKHYRYWHTHKNTEEQQSKIKKIILCGGSANLRGLTSVLAVGMKVSVEQANVWTNVFSFDVKVPEININESLGYAPAIGLALHKDV